MLNFVERAKARARVFLSGCRRGQSYGVVRLDATISGKPFDEQPIPPGLSQLCMALGMADVSDCFHRMRIPTTLGAWVLPPTGHSWRDGHSGYGLGSWGT